MSPVGNGWRRGVGTGEPNHLARESTMRNGSPMVEQEDLTALRGPRLQHQLGRLRNGP